MLPEGCRGNDLQKQYCIYIHLLNKVIQNFKINLDYSRYNYYDNEVLIFVPHFFIEKDRINYR